MYYFTVSIIIQESICSIGVIHKWETEGAIKFLFYEGKNPTSLLTEGGNQVKKRKKVDNIKEAQ